MDKNKKVRNPLENNEVVIDTQKGGPTGDGKKVVEITRKNIKKRSD